MFMILINHPRAAERRAQVALAQAVGADVFHDDSGRTYAVSPNGAHMRQDGRIEIKAVPDNFIPGAAMPIGGWEEEVNT